MGSRPLEAVEEVLTADKGKTRHVHGIPKNNIVTCSSESCLHENLALFHYADANAFFGHISVESVVY